MPVAHSGSSPSNLHAGLNERGSAGRGDFQLGGKRSGDSCQEASNTLDQSSVCGSQKQRRVATNYRPMAAKPVYRSSTLQDGGTAHATILTPAGSSPGQGRPKGCLPHSTGSQRLPAPFSLPKPKRRPLSVQGPTVRTLHCSLRLHKTYKANSSVSSLSRNPATHLPGRHAHMCTIRTAATRTTLNSPLASSSSRIHNQCTEVCPDSFETDRLFGLHYQHQLNDHNITTDQERGDTEGDFTPIPVLFSTDKDSGMSSRETGSNKTSRVHCPSSLSCFAESEDHSSTYTTRGSPSLTGGNEGSEVVEYPASPTLLLPHFEAGGLSCDNIRCFLTWLGSSLPRGDNWRAVDNRGSWFSYQPFGIESGLPCPSVLPEGESVSTCFGEAGQSDSHFILESYGGTNIFPPVSTSTRHMDLVPCSSDYSSCRVLAWNREYHSGLGIEAPSRQQQLGTLPVSVRSSESSTRPILYRSVCFQNQSSITSLLQLETRSRGPDCRCIFHIVGQGNPLLISPLLPDWQSPVEDPQGSSRACMFGSTSMAITDLVSTIARHVSRPTNTTTNGGRPTSESRPESTSSTARGELVLHRLAYLRQHLETQGLSQRAAELVIESWRDNANDAYNTAWRKWHGWCTERDINPISASVVNIVQFLVDQFDTGLQYRTINTLRSAISSTHPDIEGSSVGSHPLVSRLLRGMFNNCPPAPRYSCSWDIRTVVEFLTNHRSSTLSTLQLAKKATTLLALVNADRCSDLAALDRDHAHWTPDGVEFTVTRLTKKRSAKHPGPPRKVFYASFPENNEVCPVSVLKLYIQETAEQVANLGQPKPLFVTSRKPIHRAKPGTIGHWIKDTLRLAGIDTEVFSAHSTRGASTSWAAARGVPIGDILRAANWSSRSTFEQFYYRPSNSTIYSRTILQSTQDERYY